ncbi:patatin-like phospholipase family protein [Acidovorax sp. Root219]|uniref:patatin-like phospholipase family protein n=1 Tax=Acidovorax sp. Root219 TaxID=1736493 RepID=UPI0012FCB939|nr:patatin-like phospholipase family protein [Acidovorax sp. Root219]
MSWTLDRPFQALCLTGGGYRGLFTARALAVMEEHIQAPIGQRFDLTCGTPIGGIVALAVAFEVPMKGLVAVFEELGPSIFPPRTPPTSMWGKGCDLLKHARKPRYSPAPLREAIIRLIDRDATLNDAKHAVAIPALPSLSRGPEIAGPP